MSAGVFIIVKSERIPSILTAVATMETMTERMAAQPTVFRIPSMSPAPKRWEVSTVKPTVMPIRLVMMRNMMVPVEPTAASALFPTNFPTMIVSAML